jgi:hypothetical protein
LLGGLVNLLRLCYLLQQILHDDPVIVSHIRRRDLEVVDGGYDVELELPVRGGLEDSRVDLDLFNAWPVQLFERGDNASLFPCT